MSKKRLVEYKPPQRSALTPEQRAIAARLKALFNQRKEELELTQAKAAEALGITQGAVTQYLNQHVAITTDFVIGMCRLLGVNPRDIHDRYGDLIFAPRERRRRRVSH